MIVPEKKEDPNKRYYAATATAVFCLLFYVVLVLASVTDPDRTRVFMTEITELNITRFQPKVPEPEVQEEPEEPMAQEESPAETEVEEVNTPQRIDMSEVLPEGVQVDLSVNRAPTETAQSRSATQTESRSLRLEESEMESIGGLQSLSGGELSSPRAQQRSTDGSGGSQGGIGLAEGPEISAGDQGISDGGGTGGLLSGPQVRDGNTEGREVGLKDLNEFGDGYSDMDPIYNKLIEWMKKNPADLPIPVKSMMGDGRWDPNYLTSRVPFIIEDRQFDLLLMCKEADMEVHIFLVESKEEATYLIDSGFQREANSLRRGDVGYQNNDISEIDSQMQAVGAQKRQEFYQIFLSWWNSVEIES
jgi:hypothetical protein